MKAQDWRQRYLRRIRTVDALVVTWAAFGAYLIRFGTTADSVTAGVISIPYIGMTIIIAIAWWLMLETWDSRSTRTLGTGFVEYKRVIAASLWLFGCIAIVSYALQLEIARGFVGIAFPLGMLGLVVSRWLLRQHLSLERVKGGSMSRLLLMGDVDAVSHLFSALQRHPLAGYLPVGFYCSGSSKKQIRDFGILPLFSSEITVSGVISALEDCEADTVAISGGHSMPPELMRELGWALADNNISMIVAPALTDIAGPRISMQPVAGLPLIHVTTPKLEGGKRVAKRAFDLYGAVLLITLLSPIFILLSILTKLSSPGPVFYTQDRVGVRGATFKMIKFRSMIVDADLALAGLLAAQGTADKPLFKVENDPRITRVGRVLRKYSLDELPQLFNVLIGNMSLVGPRPQRDGEVALYDEAAKRRLYVQPGMSGLWQVSGRSNLSWEESIRLDLYYVENWSLVGDVGILMKTARAVVQSTGAV